MNASALLRQARLSAGLTQAALGERLGISQPSVAALERPGANPTVSTLERALAATGHRLQLVAPSWGGAVDASLVRDHLRRSPSERLAVLDELYEQAAWLRGARRV